MTSVPTRTFKVQKDLDTLNWQDAYPAGLVRSVVDACREEGRVATFKLDLRPHISDVSDDENVPVVPVTIEKIEYVKENERKAPFTVTHILLQPYK